MFRLLCVDNLHTRTQAHTVTRRAPITRTSHHTGGSGARRLQKQKGTLRRADTWSQLKAEELKLSTDNSYTFAHTETAMPKDTFTYSHTHTHTHKSLRGAYFLSAVTSQHPLMLLQFNISLYASNMNGVDKSFSV